VGIGLLVYLRISHNPFVVLATGAGCGLMVARTGWQTMSEEELAPNKPVRIVSVYSVLTAAIGVALLLWGVVISDWGLAAAGLPFIGIGVVLMLVPYLANRRRTAGS
jgi:hypothetical protein